MGYTATFSWMDTGKNASLIKSISPPAPIMFYIFFLLVSLGEGCCSFSSKRIYLFFLLLLRFDSKLIFFPLFIAAFLYNSDWSWLVTYGLPGPLSGEEQGLPIRLLDETGPCWKHLPGHTWCVWWQVAVKIQGSGSLWCRPDPKDPPKYVLQWTRQRLRFWRSRQGRRDSHLYLLDQRGILNLKVLIQSVSSW